MSGIILSLVSGIWVVLIIPAIIAFVFGIWVFYSILIDVPERDTSRFTIAGHDMINTKINRTEE